uniref:Uncharacterized protein n=1 Tax=Neogobius melanostomus TaxID=47308 RepID=A0A8C6TI33_9GOBI
MATLTLTQKRERYAECRWSERSTEPEVFTFELVHAQTAALSLYAPVRPKKRCTRVMYPAKVRMHLPPPERSVAKRALLLLALVLLWQVWTEEPELKLRAHRPALTCAVVPAYSSFAHERPVCPASPASRAHEPGHSGFEGARNSYAVVLLVAHRLGSD